MDDASAFSVFVGDLAPEVNDFLLQESFRQFYPTVRSAKVITDPATGRSKGFGFVRFSSETERDRALEMQGFDLGGRPIRVSLATARRAAAAGGGGAASANANAAPHPADLDPSNTTLFIGGLSAGVPEDQLRAIFGRFGDIVYVKIPAGKGCGFVQFVERPAAELAMASLNGQVIGANAIRISWGRSTSRAPAARDAAASAAAAYGGGAGAPAGAYAPPFPAGAAAGFGGFGGFGGLPGGGFAGAAAYGGGGGGGGGAAMYGAPAGVDGAAAAFSQGFAAGGFGLPAGMQAGVQQPQGPLGLLAPGAGPLANGQHQAAQHMLPHLGAFSAGGLPLANGGGGGAGFDPSAGGPDVAAMNAAYMARQQQLLGGGGFMVPRQ